MFPFTRKQDMCKVTASGLEDGHYFIIIGKEIAHKLRKLGIINDEDVIQGKHTDGNLDFLTYDYKIAAKDNILEVDIEIIIRPDHDKHRVLRLFRLVDGEIKKTKSKKDHKHWNTYKVIDREIKELEGWINKEFKHLMKAHNSVERKAA